MNDLYLSKIKTFEGYTREAKWDHAQHSNGFGTRALYPGEQITKEVAEQRFAAEIAEARAIVEKHAKGWDEGTKAALTSLTFNAGTRWISSGLGDAVRGNDIEAVKARFVEYTKAGGETLPGLVRRRLAEMAWIGSEPGGVSTAGDAVAGRGAVPGTPEARPSFAEAAGAPGAATRAAATSLPDGLSALAYRRMASGMRLDASGGHNPAPNVAGLARAEQGPPQNPPQPGAPGGAVAGLGGTDPSLLAWMMLLDSIRDMRPTGGPDERESDSRRDDASVRAGERA